MFGIDDIAAIGGLGLEVFGGIMGAGAAKQKAQAQQRIAALQIQENAVKQRSMELDNRRNQIEGTRNSQRLQAQIEANAVAGGSQFSTGLQGGRGNIAGQTNVNNLGLSQSLQLGEQMFSLSDQISTEKMDISDIESKQATDQGISSLGKDFLGSSSTLGKLFPMKFGS